MLHENATQNTDHNIISKNVTSGKKLFLFVVFQIAFTALIFYLKSSSFGVAIDLLNSENCLEILQREIEKSVGGRNQTDCAGLCHCNQMRNIDVGADSDIPPRKIKHLYEQGIEVALGNTRTNEFNLSRSWNAHEPKFDPLAEILEQSKSLISNCVGLQGSFLCGIVQCWDKNNNSIDSQCTPFFHLEPDITSDKEARYFRKDVSDQHQEPRNFHSDKVMSANRFSMVLDFYCYGAGHAVYESLTDCFVKSLVVLVPLLESAGSSKLPAVAVVSGFKLKYMEVLCRFLETRTRHLTFFLVEAQQHQIANEGLVCLAGHHVAETALELDPGFLPWYIHAPALDEVDRPRLAYTLPVRNRLASALMHSALDLRCSACTKILVICRYWSRVIIDQDDLIAALRHRFGDDAVQLYHGNETLAATGAAFSQASRARNQWIKPVR